MDLRSQIEDLMVHEPDAATPRQLIKAALAWAREDFPDLEFVGEVDAEDATIEALIHPELFEVQVKAK